MNIRASLMNSVKLPDDMCIRDYFFLAARVRESGLHMTARVTGENLMAQDLKGMGDIVRNVRFGSCDWKYLPPIACAFLWETKRRTCFEIGTVWVDPKYRGKGLCKVVIQRVMELDIARGKDLYMITAEIAVMVVAVQLGFRLVTKASMPFINKWRKNIGLRDRFPITALREELPCPKQGERWMLVKLRSW